MLTHGERPFACDQCGKSFPTGYFLRINLKTHDEARPFACDICGKAFNRVSSLRDHRRTHTDEKAYACKECGMRFRNSKGLRVHRAVHTGVMPFSCALCSKTFTSSTNINKHMVIHTGEMPYTCNECELPFAHQSSLIRHVKSHKSRIKSPIGSRKSNSYTSIHDDRVYSLETASTSVCDDKLDKKEEKCGQNFDQVQIHKLIGQSEETGNTSNVSTGSSKRKRQCVRRLHACTLCAKSFGGDPGT